MGLLYPHTWSKKSFPRSQNACTLKIGNFCFVGCKLLNQQSLLHVLSAGDNPDIPVWVLGGGRCVFVCASMGFHYNLQIYIKIHAYSLFECIPWISFQEEPLRIFSLN